MKIDLSQFRETFLEESAEHVASMEEGLLQLRTSPEDTELMHAIFRSAHSIKGGAGTFGLTALVGFTHVLESLLDRLRSREMVATEEVIGLLLQSVDALRGLLGGSEAPDGLPALRERLKTLIAESATECLQAQVRETGPENELGHDPSRGLAVGPGAQPEDGKQAGRGYRVGFAPHPEILAGGNNPLLLVRNLASLGEVHHCEMDTSRLPGLDAMDPNQCYLSWRIDLTSAAEEAEIREVFEFVEDVATITVEHLQEAPGSGSPAPMQAAEPRTAVQKETMVRRAPRGEAESTIRVATEKVDRLIDLVGELVIAHVMTEQMVEKFTPECLPQLRQAVAAMERSTRELHERVMAIRMLPIGSLFQRYTRTVYDIAQATGKQIALVLQGENTEVDKSMLDLLGDPLTHLIRNAADHGIESPEARRQGGKPEQGTIRLSACHRSGRVLLEIADDGAGIDVARVRAKAVERGMIAPDAQMSDDQIRMLIFEAGFSTRDQVSDLSGRGVGMDVVKRNIERLNGSVALSSEHGVGSRVTIELPLTLAIVEGLLVRVQDRTLVLPLLAVVETVSPAPGQIVRLAGTGEAVMIQGESVAVLRLHRYLGLGESAEPSAAAARSLIVVVEAGAKKIGLMVDEILGQQQVVLKSLERHLHKVDGLMGATILGDGCVAPILDVPGLAKMPLFAPEPMAACGLLPGALPVAAAASADAVGRPSSVP